MAIRPESFIVDGEPVRRYVVIGTTGSGKTTLAEQLADAWGHEAIDLDALHWLPNWTERPTPEFRELVASELDAASRWVVAGNYAKVRDVVWSRADAVIWLDFPLRRVLKQLIGRAIRRSVTREDLWGTGNVESFRLTFASRDSILLWALKTYRRRRREYPILLSQPEHAQLAVFQVTNDGVVRWR